jgi:protein TonB
MTPTLVESRIERSPFTPAVPRPLGAEVRASLAAILGSGFLHAAALLGLGTPPDAPPAVPSAEREIPVELVVAERSELPRPPSQEPARASRSDDHDRAPAPSMSSDATIAGTPPGRGPGAAPRASRGFETETLPAVVVPTPNDRGVEAMRYETAVLGFLERAKRFPQQALRRKARGTAVVGFALDNDGRVVVAALLRSSGDKELDVESLAVIRRAAPFPKPPAAARRKFAVDIAFGMGG